MPVTFGSSFWVTKLDQSCTWRFPKRSACSKAFLWGQEHCGELQPPTKTRWGKTKCLRARWLLKKWNCQKPKLSFKEQVTPEASGFLTTERKDKRYFGPTDLLNVPHSRQSQSNLLFSLTSHERRIQIFFHTIKHKNVPSSFLAECNRSKPHCPKTIFKFVYYTSRLLVNSITGTNQHILKPFQMLLIPEPWSIFRGCEVPQDTAPAALARGIKLKRARHSNNCGLNIAVREPWNTLSIHGNGKAAEHRRRSKSTYANTSYRVIWATQVHGET